MDFEMLNPEMESLYSSFSNNNTLQYPAQNKVASNVALQSDLSTIPVMPSAISYKANVTVDPNLWDGHFSLVSLFGTNKFLQSDAHNISCSLICIAKFIRQRNISNHDSNRIPQIDIFGEAVFDFILALHKAGWDKLNTSNKNPFRNKVQVQFANHTLANHDTAKNPIEKSLHTSQHNYLPNNWKKSESIWNRGRIRRALPPSHMFKPHPLLLTYSN